MQLVVTKDTKVPKLLFTANAESVDLLRRIANEWYTGRVFIQEMKGRRGRKGLTLARLSKMYDPDGWLRVVANPVIRDGEIQMSTDDPCGGALIDFVIRP